MPTAAGCPRAGRPDSGRPRTATPTSSSSRPRPPQPNRARSWSRSRRWPSPAIRLRTSSCAGRSSTPHAQPSSSSPHGSPNKASARPRWSSATWTAARKPRRASAVPPATRRTPAAFIHRGKVVARYAKHHLPNYGVFDEFRYFVPGDRMPVVRFGDIDIAMTICEDLWQEGGPIAVARGRQGAGSCCASTARRTSATRTTCDSSSQLGAPPKRARRLPTSTSSAARTSWSSMATHSSSPRTASCSRARLASHRSCSSPISTCPRRQRPRRHRRRARRHHDRCRTRRRCRDRRMPRTDDCTSPRIAAGLDECEEVWSALVLGTRDYVRKNGFTSVVLGLSGGIDSALVATIASDALGADAVHVVGMPSRYSSDGSVADAEELARRQGLQWERAADRADGRGIRKGVRRSRRRRAARAGRGEPAGARPRHRVDGAVQRGRPSRADDRQQERAGHRLLHVVRRQRRRVRADQGRAEDARVGAGPLAQRAGSRPAARSSRSRSRSSTSRRPRSSPPASSTATGCPTMPSLTPLLDAYVERIWAVPSSSRSVTLPSSSTA